MNRKTLSILSLAVAALAAGNALAGDASTGKTRDQVRAELAEAQRTGNLFAGKNMGNEWTGGGATKLNELYPNQYPAQAVATGKTRDQVRAELAEAQRTGDTFAGKNVGNEWTGGGVTKLNELYPNQYPAQAVATGKTRDQVRTELAEAQRSGDIVEKRGGILIKRNEVNFLSSI